MSTDTANASNISSFTTHAVTAVTPLHGFRVLGSPARVGRRALLVLCGFGPKPPRRGRWWRNIPKLVPWREWIYERMRAAAFPISPHKQLGYAKAFLTAHGAREVDLVWFDHETPLEVTDFPGLRAILSEDEFHKLTGFAGYDTVILSYPDPLGLGRSRLEKRVAADAFAPHTLVLNGRGRLIPLTPKNRALLRRRRFLAQSRICEMAFGLAVVPVAMILALIDKLRGRA